MPENTLGASVGSVLARDVRDIGENALIVSYSASESAFSVDDNGGITLTGILDRESMETHTFIVTAIDGGTPALSSSASVTVML